MNTCQFINQNTEELNPCKYKKKYGDFCCKHKRHYLVSANNFIIKNRFTYNISDYLVRDLTNYYYLRINNSGIKGKHKKQYYYDEVCKFINSLEEYDESKIIEIQALVRKKLVLNRMNIKCNNTEDFYTYDPINEIDYRYLFCYKDSKGFTWGFDIRSLFKLISMNYPNPYTIEKIPENVIKEVKKKIQSLKEKNSFEDINEIILRDRKATIKQKAVDLFSEIELNGYSCEINWFFDLSGRRLKELYKQLEDLWNYRAQLSQEMKRLICPPDGRVFTTPISEVLHYNCKEDLQELILHDTGKFKNAVNISDKKLGYMYFIIGLSMVSPECYITHQDWVSYIQ
jgi:hypothetical protein